MTACQVIKKIVNSLSVHECGLVSKAFRFPNVFMVVQCYCKQYQLLFLHDICNSVNQMSQPHKYHVGFSSTGIGMLWTFQSLKCAWEHEQVDSGKDICKTYFEITGLHYFKTNLSPHLSEVHRFMKQAIVRFSAFHNLIKCIQIKILKATWLNVVVSNMTIPIVES